MRGAQGSNLPPLPSLLQVGEGWCRLPAGDEGMALTPPLSPPPLLCFPLTQVGEGWCRLLAPRLPQLAPLLDIPLKVRGGRRSRSGVQGRCPLPLRKSDQS